MQTLSKKPAVVMSMSDKVDFQTRNIIRSNDTYFITMKGAVHQDAMTIPNL